MLVGIELGYYVISFDGIVNDVGGRCVGLLVGGVMTTYEIYAIQLNCSPSVYCKS